MPLAPIENLVFQGGKYYSAEKKNFFYKTKNKINEKGGAKGALYVGVIRALENLGILKDVKRVCGSSAGAITAFLLSLGLNAKQFEEIAGVNFQDFCDYKNKPGLGKYFGKTIDKLTDLLLIPAKGFLFSGENFSNWAEMLLEYLLGNKYLTFKQLSELVLKNKLLKELIVVGYPIDKEGLEKYIDSNGSLIFSAENTPNVLIADAVKKNFFFFNFFFFFLFHFFLF